MLSIRISSLALTLAAFIAALGNSPSVRADIMDVDVSGVPAAYRSAFLNAEQFWESRLIGWSPLLPRYVARQLTKIQISASVVALDGPGMVLGQAGPTDTFNFQTPRQSVVVSQAGNMEFDSDDIDGLVAAGLLEAVVRHEMAHALGFGPLWSDNNLNRDPFGNYTGRFGLTKYRQESGNSTAFFVPVEQGGGGGTAGAHWDSTDPFFFNPDTFAGDLMIGFITDAPYVTETTWWSFADLWFNVRGVNYGVRGGGGGGTRGPKTVPDPSGFTSVPEPSTFVGLGLVVAVGLAMQSRRRARRS